MSLRALSRPVERLRASPLLHEALPLPVALAWIRHQSRAAWKDPRVRFQAEMNMRFTLGRTARAGEIADLAPGYVYQYFKFNETLHRIDEIARFDVGHLERLDGVRRDGRPLIVSILHHGQYMGSLLSFSRCGVPLNVPADPELVASDESGPAAHRRAADRHGMRMVSAAGSYRTLAGILAGNGAVGIACDVGGTGQATFMGRKVGVAVGTWKLALEHSAPVAVLSAYPAGDKQRVEVTAVLEPGDFSSGPELLDAVFAAHEPAVLAWPEALRKPVKVLNIAEEDRAELGLEDPRISPWLV